MPKKKSGEPLDTVESKPADTIADDPRVEARSVDRLAKERKETSSSSRFSSYERVVNPDPWDGDLIVEHRGKPDPDTEPPA